MDVNKALTLVEPHLKRARFEHTKRVVDTAVDLSTFYQVDIHKTEMAAAFHDYAKYRDKAEMERYILEEPLPKDLLQYHHEIWHGPVGAILLQKEVGLTDPDILSAIRWHTTGKAEMSRLDKIIYLADYIEPGRQFPGLDEVRKQAKINLDLACCMAAKNTIQFLLDNNQSIYPDTFHAYNDLLRKSNSNNGENN